MAHSKLVFCLDLICFLTFLYLFFHLLSKTRKRSAHPPLPPGPRGLPIIGNVLQIPSSKQWEAYTEWGQEYGDLISISIFGKTLVILNSLEVALEMLDTKGSIYSDREMTSMLKLSGWGHILSLLNPGHMYRRQRALVHQLLGTPVALSRFSDLIEDESSTFLRRVLNSPSDLESHIRHYPGSIILRITYGYKARDRDDPLIDYAAKCFEHLTIAAAPATWIVDFLPSLASIPSWFPGIQFKKMSEKFAENTQKLINTPYEFVKEQMAAGTSMPSFVSVFLESRGLQATPEDIHIVKWVSAQIYGAGADTTVSIISGFFLAMALFPDVFTKAQAEIDSVIGNERLPSLSDRANLPYVDAVIQEVFRWNTVAPSGVPHKSSKDDIHAGYFIPRGSIIISNIYCMLKDPRTYTNPEQFNPERYLGSHPERDPRQIAFGFGRRACPGRLLADETIFIIASRSIALFDIRKKVRDGVVVEPVHRMIPGFVCHPASYEIDVKPRPGSEMLHLL